MNTTHLQIPGFTIAYKTWGNSQNPPIIALHGWLDNANSFDEIAKGLQDKYYIVAVDLPGHGHSSHLPAGCIYHFIDGLFIVLEILNALKMKRVHLLGHSMGACLGSLLAGVAPERFLSLSLIEGLGPFSLPAETACKQLTTFMDYLDQKKSSKITGYKAFDHAARARSTKGYVSLEIAKILCERGTMEEDGIYYWRHDRKLLIPSPLKMTEEQVLSCLSEVQCKTLLIWATSGFAFNSDLINARMKAIKHMEVKQLEGGHHIHLEEPEVVTRLLAQFIDSCNPIQ
ncbi:alpha/beta fold hydrolase [Legionella waltersii]|uniref:Lipase A n=1 Tax=Legionella waltersii TaxID=66969 RepID=A0A0W1A2F4_9GAMM|nr:alpha/beta hydrolase [Legionella waltersii]KTD75564.1 lipase A [Legionella waltersii]SNU98752.1 lipase A [Legionella waltersii]